MSPNQVKSAIGHAGRVRRLVVSLAVLAVAGCSAGCSATTPPPSEPSPTTTTTTTPPPLPPPAWTVGATPLPLRPDGFGQVLPTPPELVNRNLPTTDLLTPPADGKYSATISAVPDDVLARSTWRANCPVTPTELRYLTMSFHGFDGRVHSGEMIVNAQLAEDVTKVFGWLFDARFPIEEMRVVTAAELDAAPTGDGNNTTAFVCRNKVGRNSWSAHAFGQAIDLNPFCNPYTTGDLVLPELASSYVDRSILRPGMIMPGDAAVRGFAAIGWKWGGDWSDPVDIQHFSSTGT
jgi:hypothetical protein